MPNYTVYHLHSDVSLLDSCTNYKVYVDEAKRQGQTAICFTEHGNNFNWVEKKLYCEQQGIKYMHGCEVYLTEQLEPKTRDNYHTILIAKNYEGVKELNTLIDRSTQPDHFNYKPRISFAEFFNTTDNLIRISACLASPLAKRDKLQNPDILPELCRKYDYFEVQPHVNIQEQRDYNRYLLELAAQYQKPLIAGTDTHSLNAYKAECRSILLKAKGIHFSQEDVFDLTYHSYDQLVAMFQQQGILNQKQIAEAIQNTNQLAAEVEEFGLDTAFKYPKLGDEKTMLQKRINQDYQEKAKRGVITPEPRYLQAIREEFQVLEQIGMLGFMLFMAELVGWCWANGIPTGPCRGSVGGSVIAFITGITDVDPIRWGTAFSRFANKDRKEIGDIDLDFKPSQRELVYNHIIDEFGKDNACYILTIGTMSDKRTIEEIGRALNLPVAEVASIKKAFETDPDKTRASYPELFYYFDGLLGTALSQGIHAGGMVVSPVSLPDHYGTFWSKGKRVMAINMEEIHEVSLVKYDILGLNNIGIIMDACQLAGIPYPRAHEINWEDAKVWEDMITSGVGIFQFEENYAFEMLKRFQPKCINDMSIVNAALRPSGASYRDKLLNHETNRNPAPQIDQLLKANKGFLIFQEDTIKFLQHICGLSGSEADNVRRAIGRKDKERLEAAMPAILEGYCRQSDKPRAVAEQEAKAFLQIIEDSSEYQFGFNHSTGYSMIGYLCAYMRYYYPLEFITSYLINSACEEDRAKAKQLAAQKGIMLKPVCFGKSKSDYFFDRQQNAIYQGVTAIKNLSANVGDALYQLYQQNKPNSFIDVLLASRELKLKKDQMEILIRLDFFSDYGGNAKLLKLFQAFQRYYGKSVIKKENAPPAKLWQGLLEIYAGSVTAKQYNKVNTTGLLYELEHVLPNESLTIQQQLKAESDYLGFCTSLYDCPPDYAFIMAVDKKYSPRLTCYYLNSSRIETVKCYKKTMFQDGEWLIAPGDIIQVNKQELKPKSRYVDGNWEPTEELETILVTFTMIKKYQEAASERS